MRTCMFKWELGQAILNNYSPKWRWVAVDIHRYSPTPRWIIVLVYTKPVNSQWQKNEFYRSKLGWKGDYSHTCPLCFLQTSGYHRTFQTWVANQSVKMDIQWFGIYSNTKLRLSLRSLRYPKQSRTIAYYLRNIITPSTFHIFCTMYIHLYLPT